MSLWEYLDSSIQYDHKKLDLNGYKLARANNPNNDKRSGFGIYFRKFLAKHKAELNNLNKLIIISISHLLY